MEIYGIDIDATGNAYVTCYTESTDFPIQNANDSSYNGGLDCFILKLTDNSNVDNNDGFLPFANISFIIGTISIIVIGFRKYR